MFFELFKKKKKPKLKLTERQKLLLLLNSNVRLDDIYDMRQIDSKVRSDMNSIRYEIIDKYNKALKYKRAFIRFSEDNMNEYDLKKYRERYFPAMDIKNIEYEYNRLNYNKVFKLKDETLTNLYYSLINEKNIYEKENVTSHLATFLYGFITTTLELTKCDLVKKMDNAYISGKIKLEDIM